MLDNEMIPVQYARTWMQSLFILQFASSKAVQSSNTTKSPSTQWRNYCSLWLFFLFRFLSSIGLLQRRFQTARESKNNDCCAFDRCFDNAFYFIITLVHSTLNQSHSVVSFIVMAFYDQNVFSPTENLIFLNLVNGLILDRIFFYVFFRRAFSFVIKNLYFYELTSCGRMQ